MNKEDIKEHIIVERDNLLYEVVYYLPAMSFLLVREWFGKGQFIRENKIGLVTIAEIILHPELYNLSPIQFPKVNIKEPKIESKSVDAKLFAEWVGKGWRLWKDDIWVDRATEQKTKTTNQLYTEFSNI